jgi:hypothetical protein
MRQQFKTSLAILTTALFVVAGVVATMAGSSTITVLDSAGATQTYAVVTDGSGHFLAEQVICDYSAGANCASVNTSHQLSVAAVGGTTDNTAFTYGTTPMITMGGVYNSSITAVTNGYQGAFAMTANRSMHVLDDNSAASNSYLSTIATNSGSAIPAGSALIGGTYLVDTGGTTKATVKAASTPPATTDTAVVVAARPGTPMTPIVAAASDNHAVAKNGAGVAFSIHASNNSATANYARLYDAGTGFNGCNSATGVIFAFEIPPNNSGFSISLGGTRGIAFTNGLSYCITSGFGLTDTTNATASAILFNLSYN